MSEVSFSAVLRKLAWDYYNQRLNLQEYRAERRQILDEIDNKYNGALIPNADTPPEEPAPQEAASDAPGFVDTIEFYNDADTQRK